MRVVDNVGFNVKKQDIPGGGSGSGGGNGSGQPLATPDYLQNDETAPDYIKNRPFYTITMETELVNGTFAFTFSNGRYTALNINIELTEGNTYKVSIDGVEYETVCQSLKGVLYIGSVELVTGGTPAYPFLSMPSDGGVFATNIAGDSHDIVIKSSVTDVVPIPDKYIPKSVKATELSIGNSGLVFSDTGKLVTFSDIDTLHNHEVIIKVLTSSGSQYHKCLCIEIDESNKFAYLMFANLNSSSSDFSNVSIRRYKIDENGTANM